MAGTEAVYVFRSFRVDPARRLLLRGASPVRVTAKVFDLLLVLIRGRQRVIPRDELIEQLWHRTFERRCGTLERATELNAARSAE